MKATWAGVSQTAARGAGNDSKRGLFGWLKGWCSSKEIKYD
jgi:hypothetical protein